MSLDTLLDSLLIPSVPSIGNAREPLEAATTVTGSLGSPGSPDKISTLNEVLATAIYGTTITQTELQDALAPEDIEDWCNGDINIETLAAVARSLVQRREMGKGIVPDHYNKHATCKQCGPVWLWFSGEVLGCPWCWNRVKGRPIPCPQPVHCGNCIYFERLDHSHLGRCSKGESEAVSGLRDTDNRSCTQWLPLTEKSGEYTHGW